MIQPHTPSTRTRSARLTCLGAAALALVLAACGSPATPGASGTADAPTATTTAATTPQTAGASFPVDVVTGAADSTETVTIAERPDAIVSLSPTATESLFAIGAGDQVVAVDAQSDYPAEAPITDLSGYTPNVEAILAHEPDLVVASTRDADLIGSLANAGVPTLALPSAQTLDEAYGQIERLGTATGHLADAKAVVAQMDERIQAAVDATPKAEGATYFHELDPTLYTVTSDTFIGEVYGMFGLTSIADAAGTTDLYPQLSEEYVVAADPDLIFLSDTQCCGVTPASLGERAGWAGLSAVTGDRVHVLDEDVASRWGPRVVDFVEAVSDHVTALQTAHA